MVAAKVLRVGHRYDQGNPFREGPAENRPLARWAADPSQRKVCFSYRIHSKPQIPIAKARRGERVRFWLRKVDFSSLILGEKG